MAQVGQSSNVMAIPSLTNAIDGSSVVRGVYY